MNFARMKALRKSKGITQQQAAYDLGFSTQQRYNFYETGKREPDNETLKQIAEYFNVSADFLLGTTDDPTPPDAKKEAPDSKTPSEAAIEYFVSENGREPTIDELKSFLAVAKGLFSTLPDKAD